MTPASADALIRSTGYLALLVIVAVIGVLVAITAWCFLELTHQLQQELYVHLPHAFGYGAAPTWWPLPVLAIGASVTAVAIIRLRGNGGHVPANGLATGDAPDPRVLPGVVLAGLGTIGFGLVLGPEAPLIAIGAGVGALSIRSVRRSAQPQVVAIVAAAGSFAALSFIFTSPMIAAVLLIEATGLGGPRLRVVLLPGLIAAGIGTLVSLGIGHFTGLSSSAYALGPMPLTPVDRPTIAEFGWAIGIALGVGVLTTLAVQGGRSTAKFVGGKRQILLLPVIALAIGGLAILFDQATSHGASEVLFSGQDQLPGLIGGAGSWSIGALLLLLACKGLAYTVSLGGYRGGPTFPALFLGAAAGLLATHLPGLPIQDGVAIGMGAASVAVLRLPLSCVVLVTVLCTRAGDNLAPLIIVSVVVAYIVTLIPRIASRTPVQQAEAAA
jgi:H+/Cl- antiporter ClcA